MCVRVSDVKVLSGVGCRMSGHVSGSNSTRWAERVAVDLAVADAVAWRRRSGRQPQCTDPPRPMPRARCRRCPRTRRRLDRDAFLAVFNIFYFH